VSETIIVKDIVLEKIQKITPYYDVVTFEKNNRPLVALTAETAVIQMCEKVERVDINQFVHRRKIFRFGTTKEAEEKLPILSMLNSLLNENSKLESLRKKQNNKITDLTTRLANYEKSKIINFLHFIKIL
jgi:hypothetical protein